MYFHVCRLYCSLSLTRFKTSQWFCVPSVHFIWHTISDIRALSIIMLHTEISFTIVCVFLLIILGKHNKSNVNCYRYYKLLTKYINLLNILWLNLTMFECPWCYTRCLACALLNCDAEVFRMEMSNERLPLSRVLFSKV